LAITSFRFGFQECVSLALLWLRFGKRLHGVLHWDSRLIANHLRQLSHIKGLWRGHSEPPFSALIREGRSRLLLGFENPLDNLLAIEKKLSALPDPEMWQT
jgi:hypothetical protein